MVTAHRFADSWRIISFLLCIILIAGGVYIAGQNSTTDVNHLSRQRALTNCSLTATSRTEANNRYYVLRDFIVAAAQARSDSAAIATTPTERRIDMHAAANYRALLTRIHPLPIPDCSKIIT